MPPLDTGNHSPEAGGITKALLIRPLRKGGVDPVVLRSLALRSKLEVFAGIAERKGISRLQVDIWDGLPSVLRQELPEFFRMDFFIVRCSFKQS